MSATIETVTGSWTALDLVERLGPMPLSRIRTVPAPGIATEKDVLRIHDGENRLFELADGVLIEKTMGTYESYLAGLLLHILWTHAEQRDLGIVLGADGMLRLGHGLVRIPDVSFISWERLPGKRIPRVPIAELAPDLAVEVISQGNTKEEMDRKLRDYFDASVRLVWYVYPNSKTVRVYTSAVDFVVMTEQQSLGGNDVLPGFTLSLRRLFAEPDHSSAPA